MLTKETILNYLKEHKTDFLNDYSIEQIALFGSFATEKYNDTSDVDIVYKTASKGLTYAQLLKLEDEFQEVFHKTIDLVNLEYMNPLVKRKAIKEMIYV